jgi:hypothetical protein
MFYYEHARKLAGLRLNATNQVIVCGAGGGVVHFWQRFSVIIIINIYFENFIVTVQRHTFFPSSGSMFPKRCMVLCVMTVQEVLVNIYVSILTIGGQAIRTVKYADDPVLLAKEETVLQDMIDRLTEFGRRYGMEINVEKN